MKITERQLRKIISEEIAKVINLQEGETLTLGKYARGLLKEKTVSTIKTALESNSEQAIKQAFEQVIIDLADEFDRDEVNEAAEAAIQEVYNEIYG